MTDASKSTSTPTGSRGTAITATANTRASGSSRRLPNLTLEAEQALHQRGLELEHCARMGLVSAVVRGSGDWVAIPSVKNGAVVRWKYRRIVKLPEGENFTQDPGGEQCVWNHDALTDQTLASQPLIITEGEFDCIAAVQSGFIRAISLPNGSTIPTGMQTSGWIDDILANIEPTTKIILATDGDEPGEKACEELAVRLGTGRCKWLRYPRGCKDLNEAYQRYGVRGVAETINRAEWCRVDGVYRMSELPERAEPEVFLSGIPGLSDHYRLRRGDFTVITGIPSHGKSTFVNDLACHMADRHQWTIGFASFEQNPKTDHRRALRTWFGKRKADKQTADEIAKADTWVDERFGFIVPKDDQDTSLEWVLEKAATLVTHYGAQMIIIDPWNEIDHERPAHLSITEYVNGAIRRFKRFARSFNVHLIIVAHPTKLEAGKDGRPRVPSLYDISDSAAWANKSDVGIVVYRCERETTIKIAKTRYQDRIGRTGEVKYMFSEETNRYCPV